MSQMINYFRNSAILNCDCYVADYTNSTGNARGVEISTSPFDDIDYFHLKKKISDQNLPYLAVNLEKYPAFIKGIENCECVFSSLSEAKKTWILMLETKYCEAHNIEDYTIKACSQMEETLCKLEKLNLTSRTQKRVYFAFSIPEHSDKAPFGAFTLSQDYGLKMKEKGIHVLGYNTVLIATASFLQIPLCKI
ncbi:MAG: hypothetical protein K2L96_01630 [Muribaculaceae bacterium]|nr:hypothetical protein [Muribaculaceae bacterium]